MKGEVPLQEHHALDLRRAACPVVIRQQVRLVQQRNVVQPRIPDLLWIPKMQMGINNGEINHDTIFSSASPSTAARAIRADVLRISIFDSTLQKAA